MLMCNPNACYYEYAVNQSEWLEYYNNLGINVILWNYRGYGFSTKSLSPKNSKQDGVEVG